MCIACLHHPVCCDLQDARKLESSSSVRRLDLTIEDSLSFICPSVPKGNSAMRDLSHSLLSLEYASAPK